MIPSGLQHLEVCDIGLASHQVQDGVIVADDGLDLLMLIVDHDVGAELLCKVKVRLPHGGGHRRSQVLAYCIASDPTPPVPPAMRIF